MSRLGRLGVGASAVPQPPAPVSEVGPYTYQETPYDYSRPLTAEEVAFAQQAFGETPQAATQIGPQTQSSFWESITNWQSPSVERPKMTTAPSSTAKQITVPLFQPQLIQPYAPGLTMSTQLMIPTPVTTQADAKKKTAEGDKKAATTNGDRTKTLVIAGAAVLGIAALIFFMTRR